MARTQRRKACAFCKRKLVDIDYKDAATLAKYMSSWSKIRGASDSGACAKHQRRLTKAIKRARYLAILPYVTR